MTQLSSHSKVHWENAKKNWYYEKRVGRHASFPSRRSVKVKHWCVYKSFYPELRHFVQRLNGSIDFRIMILPLNKLRSDYSASVCRWFYERGHASCLHFTVQCYCIWHMYVYTLMHSVSTVAHPNLCAINCGVSRLSYRVLTRLTN